MCDSKQRALEILAEAAKQHCKTDDPENWDLFCTLLWYDTGVALYASHEGDVGAQLSIVRIGNHHIAVHMPDLSTEETYLQSVIDSIILVERRTRTITQEYWGPIE